MDVINGFSDTGVRVKVMRPFEIFDDLNGNVDNSESIQFWEKAHSLIDTSSLREYDTVPLEQLKKSFILPNYSEKPQSASPRLEKSENKYLYF